MDRDELLKGLTKEQIEKVEGCSNLDDLLALADTEGVALTDEQLKAVSGGCGEGEHESTLPCPMCGGTAEAFKKAYAPVVYVCTQCGHTFQKESK